MDPILRFQDKEGRGPFRPGLPALWGDAEGDSPPTIFDDFPDMIPKLAKYREKGLHLGCACVGMAGILAYFTGAEIGRLKNLGFNLHRAPHSTVIAQSQSQVLIAVPKPLKSLPRFRT